MMDHIGGDQIASDMGDNVQNATVGKGNRQRISNEHNGTIVNNYIDQNRSRSAPTPDRLDQLEQISNRLQADVRRALFFVEGDKTYRREGIVDQLPAYIKANEEWKEATERRIVELEAGNQIVISPQTAILIGALIIVSLIAIYFVVVWLQRGGSL